MTANPLVAEAKAPGPVAGLGLIGDVAMLKADHDPWDYTIDGVCTALDVLGTVMDPFGTIAVSGIAWLLNHVEFLREPLNKLTGDAAAVTAMTSTWENIAERLHQSAQTYVDSLRAVESWAGLAAEHYRAAARDLVDLLSATGDHASHAAKGMVAAGILVATERGIVYDIICTFVGRLIVEALVAMAASWFTFGASLAAFVTAVDIDAALTSEYISLQIGKLMRAVAKVAKRFDSMGTGAKTLANDLHRAGGAMRMKAGGQKGLKTIAKNRYIKGDHSPAVQHLLDASAALRSSPLGTVRNVTEDPRFFLGKSIVTAGERHHKGEEARDDTADDRQP